MSQCDAGRTEQSRPRHEGSSVLCPPSVRSAPGDRTQVSRTFAGTVGANVLSGFTCLLSGFMYVLSG